ncbi:MAG: response regulator [Nitrospirae bacterium]|nr:response regulator [Candidatus Manganitrophaceae bacterium]
MSDRILIADDHQETRSRLTALLTAAGYEVILAADGRQAVEKAKKDRPDLVLLDLKLPENDSLDVCDTLKSLPKFQSTPILILTDRAEIPSQEKSLKQGPGELIPAKFHPTDLLVKVQGCLHKERPRVSNA